MCNGLKDTGPNQTDGLKNEVAVPKDRAGPMDSGPKQDMGLSEIEEGMILDEGREYELTNGSRTIKIAEDAMYHKLGGTGTLQAGEYFDPIIFLNEKEYHKEVARRKWVGGVSIKKRDIFEYDIKGNSKPTKRFWIRNEKEDGSLQEFLQRIEREIKDIGERCNRSGEERVRDSKTLIDREIISINEDLQEAHEEEIEKEKEKEERRMETKTITHHEDRNLFLGGDTDALQSLLKESMADSMREVIKNELQTWLGLKCQFREEEKEQPQEKTEREEKTNVDKGEGVYLAGDEVSPIIGGEDEDYGIARMISPMKEIVEEEERQAREIKERRTSRRQANQRQSKDYEVDTLVRAAKRKEGFEGMSNDIFSVFDVIPAHLIVHIAHSCGLSIDFKDEDLNALITSSKERRKGSYLDL